MAKLARFVVAVRVHEGRRLGQRRVAGMVVEHDDVGALGCGDGFRGLRAAVDADDQIVRFGEAAHRLLARPVALLDPVRDVVAGGASQLAQPADELRARRGSVDVVVGEHHDPPAAADLLEDPRRRGLHVLERMRIGQKRAQLGIEMGMGAVGGHSVQGEHAAQLERQAACALDFPDGGAERLGAIDPDTAADRALDVEKCAHGSGCRQEMRRDSPALERRTRVSVSRAAPQRETPRTSAPGVTPVAAKTASPDTISPRA